MTDTPRRIRIDAILNGIRSGQYDDSISAIENALDERREQKKAELERLVREIYGDGYIIAPRKSSLARLFGESAPEAVPSAPIEASADVIIDPLGGEELDPDIESRSPLISGGPPA